MFFEWSLELLFPRDISLLNVKMTEVVGRVHLEKGDPIYHLGDAAFSFYLIEKGNVEVNDRAGLGQKRSVRANISVSGNCCKIRSGSLMRSPWSRPLSSPSIRRLSRR